MELQKFKQDFTIQLQQEYDKINDLNVKINKHQQQALKLQGAIGAIDLIMQSVVDDTKLPKEDN